MSRRVIPLRPIGNENSAVARIDIAAVALLSGGHAASLQAARAEAILADLRLRRDEMTMLLSEMRGREPTGVLQVDAAQANLIIAISEGVVQVDRFIAQAQGSLERFEPSRAAQPDASGQTLKDT